MRGKVIVWLLILLGMFFVSGERLGCCEDCLAWQEIVNRAKESYQQGEKALDQKELLDAYFYFAQAGFVFVKDKALAQRIENIKAELLAQLTISTQDPLILEKKLEDSEKELFDLKRQLIEEKQELQQYYDQKMKELEQSYKDKIDVLNEKHNYELSQLKRDYESLLEEKRLDYSKRLNDFKNQMHQIIVALQSEIKKKDNTIAEKQKKIKELLKSYSALESVLEDKYSGRIKSLTDQIQSLKKKVSSLKMRVSDQKQYIANLEKTVSNKDRAISKLKAQIKELKSTIMELKREGKACMVESEKKLQDCHTMYADAKVKIKNLAAEINRLHTVEDNLKTKIDVLQAKLDDRETMLADLKDRLKERDIIINNLKDKISELKRRIFSLEHSRNPVSLSSAYINRGGKEKTASSIDKIEKIDDKKLLKTSGVSKETAKPSSKKDFLDSQELFDEAMTAIDNQDYKLAQSLLREVLKKDPNNTVARYMLDSVNLLLEE